MLQKLLKGLGRLALAVLIGFALILGLLWLDHLPTTQLPKPTGPFAVGRILDYWSDVTPDPRAAPPGDHRYLAAWIWYPVDVSASVTKPAPYMPAEWQAALRRYTSPVLRHFVLRDPANVRSYSVANAEIARIPGGLPVLLLRGGHSALVASYTSLAEELASHGYVVVGVDAPYRSFVVPLPDGRAIPRADQNNVEIRSGAEAVQLADVLADAWSQDLRFTVDKLQQLNAAGSGSILFGRLDLSRLGALGHSLGGASSLQFCHDDARCRAVADIDGAPFGSAAKEGVKQPTLILLGEHAGEADPQAKWVNANFASLIAHIDAQHLTQATIPGASHFGFADPTKSPTLMRLVQWIGGRTSTQQQIAQTSEQLLRFFDRELQTVSRPPAVAGRP